MAGDAALDVGEVLVDHKGTPILLGAADVGTRLELGESTIDRGLMTSNAIAPASGAMRFAYFTARKTEVVSQVRMGTGSTAAGATPTICRIGVYEEAPNGDLTMVASTVNDTTLFAATATGYTRSFSLPFQKVAGRRYAVAPLVVTAAAMPTFCGLMPLNGLNGFIVGEYTNFAPRQSGGLGAQADLPLSVAAGAVSAQSMQIYAVLFP